MSRFADPSRCPDCGTPLAPGSAVCQGCGIDLSGPLGRELFATLVHADTLLTRLRAAVPAGVRQPVASGSTPPPPGAATPTPAPLPPFPVAASTPEAMRPSRAPQLLLGLGAVCLVVAAMVFLAVTWSRLGVGGRTAVLVLLTAAAGAVTVWGLRRGLRSTAEALGTVAAGLFTLDLLGARTAGWLGSPGDAAFVTWLGVALVAVGLAAALGAARTQTGRLTVAESLAVVGAILVCGGVAALPFGTTEGRTVLAVLAAAAVAATTGVLHRRTPLRVALLGTAIVTAGAWCLLVVVGLEHVAPAPTVASVVGRGEGWVLAAAALLAGLAALLRLVPLGVRVLCGGAAVVVLTLAVTAPVLDEPATPATLVAVAVLLATSAVMVVLPKPWGAVGLGAALLAALVTGVEALVLGTLAAMSVVDTALPVWGGTTGGSTAVPGGSELSAELGTDTGAAWLLPLTLVALVVAWWATSRLLPTALGSKTAVRAGAVALALGGVGALVLAAVPVALPLALLLASGVAGTGLALAGPERFRDGLATPAWATATLLAALPLSFHDTLLTLVALLVVAGALTALHLLHRHDGVVAVAGTALPPALAASIWTAGAFAELSGGRVALAGLLALAVLVVARAVRARAAGRDVSSDPAAQTPELALELAALVSAVVLAGSGLDATSGSPDWLAGYLTCGGVAASLLALVRHDRRPVGWLGGVLLVAATWVRLADADVEVVEAYTLPSAIALLVVGGLRLHRDPSVSTYRALSAGLGVGLVPSLLVAVEEPLTLRALLLGLVCLALVVAGAVRRWAAPLTYGTAVALLLVLREAGPYLGDSVPRWAVIGAAGALLVVLGTTWEQRLRNARAVAGYVRGLR